MGRGPTFYLPWLWDIRQITLNHLVEWVKQSCRNSFPRVRREISRRIVFCKIKVPGLIYLFRTVSEKIFGLLAFLSAILAKFFLMHREEIGQICFWEKRCFSNVSEHWKNLDAVQQTSGPTSSKLPFTCTVQFFCQNNVFCKVPSIIILGHFLKKT